MIREKIIASLDNMKIPADRKDIVLSCMIKKANIQRASRERTLLMKKKKLWKYVASFAAVAVLVVTGIIAFPLLSSIQQEVSLLPEQPEGSIAVTLSESPAGKSFEYGDSTEPLTDLEIKTEYAQPSRLYIAKQSSVQFTEEDKKAIIHNLAEEGWHDVSGKISSFQSDTQFMLNFSQPETYDYSIHGEKDEVVNFSNTEKHVEFAQQFVADSGIVELLQRHGVVLSNQPQQEHTTLFYGYFEGYRTDTYLRLHFSPDGTLEDAQIYAVSFTEPFLTSNVRSLEEAIENAFYCSECTGVGDKKYSIIGVEIVYKSGLPFYELKLNNEQNGIIMNGYALAVNYNEVESDAELEKAFNNLLRDGIW